MEVAMATLAPFLSPPPSGTVLCHCLPSRSHRASSLRVALGTTPSTTPSPRRRFPAGTLHLRRRRRGRHSFVFASVQTGDVVVDLATNVKFLNSLSAPGASKQLSLVGTGFREKAIAFIGVKVYAIGMYVDGAISASLSYWKNKAIEEVSKDAIFFKNVAEADVEKCVMIVLVRDVDGATFWGALDEALGSRIKAANAGPSGQEALIAFGDVFRGRNLKRGTTIYLTSAEPSTLQVAVSCDGTVPSKAEATIESTHLVSALFDVYLGESTVSPTLKAAVASGLKTLLESAC